MESRIGIFLLKLVCGLVILGLFSGCSLLRVDDAPYEDSEPVIKPNIERRTVTEADIDSEDFEIGAFVGVMNIEDFGSNVVYGARLAYHITEDFFTEVSVGRSKADRTSFEDLSGGAEILSSSQRKLTYYNVSIGYNILPGEAFIGKGRAFNSALYVIGGIGNTDFADDNHFTVNVGVGYRLLLTDAVALHVDFRDHIYESDLLGNNETKNNLEATAGISFFF